MTLKFFTCVLLCFMALQLCVLGRTKRNIAQTECEFGDWEAWSNCSATCGAPMRTRVRTCICNDEVAEAVNCQGEATEQSYCPSSCVRNAAYWRNYNSETTRPEFDKPWPLANSESNIFYCDLGADAAKMALTWFEIINKPNPAPSDPWLSLATQYIAAVQNVEAGVNITETGMERALIDAGQLLRVCNGYTPTDLSRVSVVYQFIGKFNTASFNWTTLCEETPCCYVSTQDICKCPGYAVDEAILPTMCNLTETSTQPESADANLPVDETADETDEAPEVPAPADKIDVVPQAPAPAVPSKTVPSTVPVVARPCVWLAWTESPCNVSCGGGTIVRTRPCSCDGFTPETSCPGEQPTEMKPCNTQECLTTQDCHWLEWGQYTPCSVECGGGTMVRRKACSCPEPAEENGACEGESPVENAACNINPCPESVESSQPQEANHTNTVTDGQGAAKPVEFGQGSFDGDGNAMDESLPQASSSFSQSIANLLSTSYFLIPVGIILTVAITITVTVLAMRRIYSGRIFEIPDIPDDLDGDDDEEIELDSATLKKLQGTQYKV